MCELKIFFFNLFKFYTFLYFHNFFINFSFYILHTFPLVKPIYPHILYLKFTAPHWKEYQNCLSAAHNKIFALLIRRLGSRYWRQQGLFQHTRSISVWMCVWHTRAWLRFSVISAIISYSILFRRQYETQRQRVFAWLKPFRDCLTDFASLSLSLTVCLSLSPDAL